jgi:hypothetical protein
MDPKSDEGIFLGYSINHRAYLVFSTKTKTMMESINVVIDDSPDEKVSDVEFDVTTSFPQSEDSEESHEKIDPERANT